jgi:hypothetical protein
MSDSVRPASVSTLGAVRGDQPVHWRAEAEGLLRAYRILASHWLETHGPDGRVIWPALMLAGYAIENYAKARLLELGELDEARKGNRGHDLPWLVERARIEVNGVELDLLQRLEQFVRWSGRYPAPFRADAERSSQWATDRDFETIERLIERLSVTAT